MVGVAGGIGAICRYLILLAMQTTEEWLGLSTLIVNTVGCLLIGIFAGILVNATWSAALRESFVLLLMTGFCGGFSTFSAFTLDSVRYFEAGKLWIWVIFGSATVFFGLFACALGYWLGQKF